MHRREFENHKLLFSSSYDRLTTYFILVFEENMDSYFATGSRIEIANVKFSLREIDVMACIMNGRTSKKSIASTLEISYSTVATHIGNILSKIQHSSWEGIRTFIEKSGQKEKIQCHFLTLVRSERFHLLLREYRERLKNLPGPTFRIRYAHQEREALEPLISKIETAFDGIGHPIEFQCIPEKESDSTEGSKTLVLIHDDGSEERLRTSEFALPELMILKILEKAFGLEAVSGLRKDFQPYTQNVFYEKGSDTTGKDPFWRHRNFKIFLMMVAFFGILSLLFISGSAKNIRSDLVVPIEAQRLSRESLAHEVASHFKNSQREIPYVVLVGMRGAGKTILARMVGRQHPGSFVWELKATSLMLLKESFREMAEVLARTEILQQELKGIKDMPEGEIKDKKILSFVKCALQKEKNWLLIFDDAETLVEVESYIPADCPLWGRGGVLITTYNANLAHADILKPDKTIQMGTLTEEESLELFSRILYDKRTIPLDERIKALDFLKNIPAFPLDICIAAEYIKLNGLSYQEYLERMSQQAFHETQESLLREMQQLKHSRYHLMTLSWQKILDSHPEFVDLAFLICCLDAQAIPRDILNMYKASHIVDSFILQMNKYSLIQQGKAACDVSLLSVPKVTQQIGFEYLQKVIGVQNLPHRMVAIVQSLERVAHKALEAEDLWMMRALYPHIQKIQSLSLAFTERPNLDYMLGCFDYYLGNLSQTVETLSAAIPQLRKARTPDWERIATGLSYLGDIYKSNGKYKESIQCLEEASQLFNHHRPRSIRHARALSYLGNVYRMVGDYGRSRAVLEQSIAIYKGFSPQSLEIAQPLSVLGTVYRDMGEYKKSVEVLDKGLRMLKKYASSAMWKVGTGC